MVKNIRYALLLPLSLMVTEANAQSAQVFQDNLFGDNVSIIQQNRPARQVTKKTRVVGRKTVNNYTIIENNTVVQQPAAPAPVQQTTVVNMPPPVYRPPMPVPVPVYPGPYYTIPQAGAVIPVGPVPVYPYPY